MNKQQLAAKIWESANQMRSKIEANEYKDYILGFIFYKYLSDKEIQFAKKEGLSDEEIKSLTEENGDSVDYFKENLGYFIAYNNRFSTWIEIGKDFDVSHVRDALSAFSRLISSAHKKLFDGVFDTLQTGLSKLGDSAASQTRAISELIHLIKDIPMDGKQDYDVLGFVYEYLISMFAANAGKKAGEFYTPHEVSLLMSEIVAHHLKDKKEIQIYDPTSGSGSLLINIGSSVAKHMVDKNNIKYYAQELKKNTYNLTRMNLVMRGILPNNILTRNGDTLEDDWPYFDENDPVGSYNPLYVDASKGFIKVGKNNKLRASDIKRIADTVIKRETNPKYSKVVSRDVIRGNEYNLNIPRYVDSSENGESWDIYSSMFGGIPQKELGELDKYWQAFPGLRDALFSKTSSDYAALKGVDVKNTITHHSDVKKFAAAYLASFGDFDRFLKNELLTQMESVNISKEEVLLSENVFARLKSIALIDKYEAYQLLDDEWLNIAVDLEIIQTEGFAVTRQVDPHMVPKKKNGKDQEVQEGWIVHILPFELVQKTYLNDELQNLKRCENRLAEISSEYEEILDSLTEEEKEAETIKETNDAFVNASVLKEAKLLKVEEKKNGSFAENSFEVKILKVDKLIDEEKKLKSQVKAETAKLHLLTKETIENLGEKQVYELLELKWISPLVSSLNKLPETIINELTAKVQTLAEKYATTYADVAEEIHDTEKALSSLIDELTGNEFDMKGLGEFKSFLKGE